MLTSIYRGLLAGEAAVGYLIAPRVNWPCLQVTRKNQPSRAILSAPAWFHPSCTYWTSRVHKALRDPKLEQLFDQDIDLFHTAAASFCSLRAAPWPTAKSLEEHLHFLDICIRKLHELAVEQFFSGHLSRRSRHLRCSFPRADLAGLRFATYSCLCRRQAFLRPNPVFLIE